MHGVIRVSASMVHASSDPPSGSESNGLHKRSEPASGDIERTLQNVPDRSRPLPGRFPTAPRPTVTRDVVGRDLVRLRKVRHVRETVTPISPWQMSAARPPDQPHVPSADPTSPTMFDPPVSRNTDRSECGDVACSQGCQRRDRSRARLLQIGFPTARRERTQHLKCELF